jgi:excisionase family DNA binding protein
MTSTFLLNTVEAAKYLHLAVPTLEKLRVYGGGPRFVRLGRAVRYRPADLEAWLESRVRTSTSDTGAGHSLRKRAGHDR